MSVLSQIRNTVRQRHSIGVTSTVESLIAALSETECALRLSVEAEEERTSLRDQDDPSYSLLARSMRIRADNLRMTITTLEAMQRAA